MGFIVLLLSHQTWLNPALNPPRPSGYPLRDRDAFAAIVDALTATSEFSQVMLDASPSLAMIGADRNPLAIVVPTEWHENADTSAGSAIRRVAYILTLAVRIDNPRERYEALERLSGIAMNTLSGSSHGGFCLAALSRLGRGRYDSASRHPELRVEIDGEFSYAIPTPSAREASR